MYYLITNVASVNPVISSYENNEKALLEEEINRLNGNSDISFFDEIRKTESIVKWRGRDFILIKGNAIQPDYTLETGNVKRYFIPKLNAKKNKFLTKSAKKKCANDAL